MALGDYEGILCHACIGGTSVKADIQAFESERQPHIVVGTPGRVYDMINRGYLSKYYLLNCKLNIGRPI